MADQPLVELKIQPGIFRDQAPLAAGPFWWDADKVRFRLGKPESIGGWQRVAIQPNTFYQMGITRALLTWTTLMGKKWIAGGSNVGLFLTDGDTYFDITPIKEIIPVSGNLATTAGSNLVQAFVSTHGMTVDSLIGFTSATATIGGNIVLNPTAATTVQYQIVSVETDSFTFRTPVTASSTEVSVGGAFTQFHYLPAGLRENTFGFGWGAGTWGQGTWGTPRAGSVTIPLRLWTLDTWGTDLLANPRGGQLYTYQGQEDSTIRAVVVTAAPSIIDSICVSPEDRHVVAYGTHDISGTYDPLLIRWATQESLSDWLPTLTNTAGDKRLAGDATRIVRAIRANRQIAIFTNSGLHIQQFIGPPDTFGFTQIGKHCGLISPNGAVEIGGRIYWMSNAKQFFTYSGKVDVLPCTVLRYVFDNLHPNHLDKIYAGANQSFNEVIWLYQSNASAEDVDRYVIFNFEESTWTIGTLRRTAWYAADVFDHPVAACPNNQCLFFHEISNGSADGSPFENFIETSYGTLQDGDQLVHLSKTVPEFIAPDGSAAGQPIRLLIKGRRYPSGEVEVKGPYEFTNLQPWHSTRMRARELAFRFEHTQTDKQWRLGKLRAAIGPDGHR